MVTAMTDKDVGDYWIKADVDHSLGSGSTVRCFLGKHKVNKKEVAAKLSVWEEDLVTQRHTERQN